MSGFCMTRHHATCKYTITYYDKTWTCGCECHEENNDERSE